MTDFILDPTFSSETNQLFNPAFCAILLHDAAKNYRKKSENELPVTFAFIVLPNALHQPTRLKLPDRASVSMWAWIRDHPILMSDFSDRVQRLRPYIAASIKFGLQHGVLTGLPGMLAPGDLKRRPKTMVPTDDWEKCRKSASFIGKWLAISKADEATMLALWGLRP